MTKERLRKIIGENIRSERVARNMSIDELAELLGFSSSFVGLMERGRRGVTAYNIYRLSEIFEFGVDSLFSMPSHQTTKFAESGNLTQKRNKLLTLTHNLSENELEFLISTVKNLKTMKHAVNEDSISDPIDDED